MIISIVIPVHNRAEMVKPTLESVKKQTYRPIHLVLVDNNSTDGTLQGLLDFKKKNETQDFKIDVIEEKKHGACAARNAGAKLVDSEWLMFFDSDDTMDDCLVAKYVQKIKEYKGNVDLIRTNADGEGFRLPSDKMDLMTNHIFHSVLSTQRYIIRKSLFDRVGGWDETVMCWNDWELGIRVLLQDPKVVYLNDGVYVHIKVHDDSITGSCFSKKHENREHAVNVALEVVRNSDNFLKNKLIKYLIYRKFLLSGLYRKEKHIEISKVLLKEACDELRHNRLLRLFYNILYWYVAMGGRGSQRMVGLFVR